MPASRIPIASTTAMQPPGMASIAARVERGEDQDSGVARSSRAGTKRSVKARPTRRGWPSRKGCAPRIQTLRRPFFSNRVVRVAVVTDDSVSMMPCSSAMAAPCSEAAPSRDARPRVRSGIGTQMLATRPPSMRTTEPVT